MSNFRKIFASLTGRLYIPKEISELQGKTLLHISDTPLMIYSNIQKLIATLKPDYIVHTGDMVDNIKLELYPQRIREYRKHLKKLGTILGSSPETKVYIATGNHDDIKLVNELIPNSHAFERSTDITVENRHFRISHYSEQLSDPYNQPDISFFGHDLSMHSQVLNGTIYLNGIEHIHIVELDTLNIIQLDYPVGTDDSRLCRRKIGM